MFVSDKVSGNPNFLAMLHLGDPNLLAMLHLDDPNFLAMSIWAIQTSSRCSI
jgi:hypothetical protein